MLNNVNVTGQNISEHFAGFCDKKVLDIVSETIINPMVYNNTIPLNWLNLLTNTYKLKCKLDFLTEWKSEFKGETDNDKADWLLCFYLIFVWFFYYFHQCIFCKSPILKWCHDNMRINKRWNWTQIRIIIWIFNISKQREKGCGENVSKPCSETF